MFGVLTLVSSLAGVVGGAWLAQKLRPRYATADPLVCGVGLLASAPPLLVCLSFSRGPAAVTYAVYFLGGWLLNLNWAITGDLMLVRSSEYFALRVLTRFDRELSSVASRSNDSLTSLLLISSLKRYQ